MSSYFDPRHAAGSTGVLPSRAVSSDTPASAPAPDAAGTTGVPSGAADGGAASTIRSAHEAAASIVERHPAATLLAAAATGALLGWLVKR